MKSVFLNLRFRTRLVLVMFLTMACTGAILTWSYFKHRQQVLNYVVGETSRLLNISQFAQTQIPPDANVDTALKIYQKKLQDLGLSSVSTTSTEGQVVASTNPGQVGKRFLSRRDTWKPKRARCVFPRSFRIWIHTPQLIKPSFTIQYPLVLGDKVIGYAVIKGESDQAATLARMWYKQRLYWILGTMLAALCVVLYLSLRFHQAH